MAKRIPIGVDDFSELVSEQQNFLFVDKTLMIKELIDRGTKVSLIIRPRRWGKTLNMSMLRYFFSSQVNGYATHGIFDRLKIADQDQVRVMMSEWAASMAALGGLKEGQYCEAFKYVNTA